MLLILPRKYILHFLYYKLLNSEFRIYKNRPRDTVSRPFEIQAHIYNIGLEDIKAGTSREGDSRVTYPSEPIKLLN